MASSTIPVIDFAAFYDTDAAAKDNLISKIGEACRTSGFFSLVNHGIAESLQQELLSFSEEFFSLPLHVKETYGKDIGGFNRGYERLRAQNFEKRTEGDLKEGFYFGMDLPLDHPSVIAKKFSQGPNKYPSPADMKDADRFQMVINTYFDAMRSLAESIIRVLCETLNIEDSWVSNFVDTPIATLRLLHYPPQLPSASELERGKFITHKGVMPLRPGTGTVGEKQLIFGLSGVGAHTDFGAVTILLQDMVGGLQVLDRATSDWINVEPVPGAMVVNLGNLMMRWTNDQYLSNLHRVINKSGKERYSVPFFFSGNPDFLVECFPSCEDPQLGAKYPSVKVEDWIGGRYADTYGPSGGKGKAIAELSVKELTAGTA